MLAECEAKGAHFLCHKGTLAGTVLTCRGWHDANGPNLAMRFATVFGLPVREVDPDALSSEAAR